jgi:hypothetical protein
MAQPFYTLQVQTIHIMDNQALKDNWPAIKHKMQQQYPSLTEDDLVYEIGKEGELLERLQQKLGKNKQEMDKWLSLLG